MRQSHCRTHAGHVIGLVHTPCAGAGIPDQEIPEGIRRQGASGPSCSAVHSRGILKPPADTSRLSCHGHMGGTRMFVLPVWCYVR
ncbi:hypothetical protein CFR78_06555 [Komagataeibacter rhaeticus]|nr:hypothetical protein GLUCORHAEAF1_09130 [Komagataeibacter rhaeticus AF1]PYD54048.1 hypothetical protein CFR78_06555 [Komagataeibacter rhaeticus]